MASAAREAGRDPGDVTLVAVSKQQPDERIDAMLAAGQRVFGENRVQEARIRWAERRAGVELRLIGPLQTNKAREALALFDVIETVDRESLARTLAEEIQRAGPGPRLYVQINTGEEPQKAGVLPADLDGFLQRCGALGLAPFGLMCIPPEGHDPALHFDMLRAMAARHALPGLSMGMSSDFEAAIAAGATHIRIGSAIFGARV